MKSLKKLRARAKITQAGLGKVLKVSPGTIGLYEQGRREPDRETLIALSKYFNVSIDYLLENPVLPELNRALQAKADTYHHLLKIIFDNQLDELLKLEDITISPKQRKILNLLSRTILETIKSETKH